MKKLLVSLLCGLLVLSLFGCGKKDDETELTLGETLKAQFEEEVKKSTDCLTIATAISENKAIEFDVMAMEVSEGYLSGFEGEITGFNKGAVCAALMMGQPFIVYVFEVDDAAAFLSKLEGVADPRWNICTEAGETVTATSGNLVFFAMCPGAEEE